MARSTLSRERVLDGAVAVADAGGIAALTIRNLAEYLGVKPMAVYHYVANKEEILDGVVDRVFAEMRLPLCTGSWRTEISERCYSARLTLRRHSWATGLLDSRTSPGPATLAHHDATIATFRAGGFTIAQTAHAYALIDAFVYGFAVQEAALPFEGPDSAAELAGPMVEMMGAVAYPNVVELMTEHVMLPGYDFGAEFDFGLELILHGLEHLLASPNSNRLDES